jgi:hypothetical protein
MHSSTVLVAYNSGELDVAVRLERFLDASIATMRTAGLTSIENEFLAWKAQLRSALEGTNPLTLERPTTYRRRMQRSVVLHVILQSSERLRAEAAVVNDRLDEARALLARILLHARQEGLVPGDLTRPPSQHELEALWRSLYAHPATGAAARQLAIQVSQPDIYIMLAELVPDL